MEKVKLAPCPFCGREKLKFNGEYHANYRSHVIECDCSIKMYGRDSVSLRKQWNTRAEPNAIEVIDRAVEVVDDIEKSELWAQMGIPAECQSVYVEKFEQALEQLKQEYKDES